ncbi:MAG: hypothetical protein ACI9H6_000070 [Patiriisocius sp.]|jgi:hypothetical protein
MIRITDQYFWNVVFGLFFVALVIMGSIILDTEAHMTYADLDLFDIVIISLASFRMIRLFVFDTMTKFFREQFYDAKVTKAGKVTLYKPLTGPRRTIADLMGCPWCFGVWASAIIIFFYLLTPAAFFPILILAISAVATFMQNVSRLVSAKADVVS